MADDIHEEEPTEFWRIRDVQVAAISGALLVGGLAASTFSTRSLQDVAFGLALLVGGSTFVPATLRNLAHGRLNVGTLMTVAAVGAVLLGELGEAASLAFLFSISEALEEFALSRTRRGLRSLLTLVPEVVTVRRSDGHHQIASSDLRVGDRIVLSPGSRLATDGIVRAGRSTVDLSAITGESIPVEVEPGREILAAAVNGMGVLEIEVTARTTESSLARVVRSVEAAQERKGSSQRLAERVARPLVPAVMVVAAMLAVAGSIFGDPGIWIGRALVVLVAAAPCAFAMAVPVTVIAGIGASARMGALVKGGAALEALAGIRTLAMDKTGTLTRNEPRVVDVVVADGSSRVELLRVAAALEGHSDHPLAAAVLTAAPQATPATQVRAMPGNGIVGVVDGESARLGKPGFVPADDLDRAVHELEADGATVILVEKAGVLLGAIAVRDELRPEASGVVASLRSLGVDRVVMLTGDNERAGLAIAQRAGITEVHAGLEPQEKLGAIATLSRSARTAMVGDGINDAPALASAHVGIAMGAMGSDVAIEAADVALMGEDLSHLPDLFKHANRAGRIMRQNLVLSGLILVLLVPLAAFGVLGLATVVATHELAEVVVILNGVRAGRLPG